MKMIEYRVGTFGNYVLVMHGQATIAARDEREPRARANVAALVAQANAAPELADTLRDVNTYFANLRGLNGPKGVTQAESDAIIARVAAVLAKVQS